MDADCENCNFDTSSATGYFSSPAKSACVVAAASCVSGAGSTTTVATAGTAGSGADCGTCIAATHNKDRLNFATCVTKGSACATGYASAVASLSAAGVLTAAVTTAGTTTTGADCSVCA